MGIKYKPKQGPEIAARAGAATGAAEKAKTEQRINLALEAEERAKMWELTKMELSSQQQYAHEARMKQVELDKEARAHEWVIEKAEIASRMDFQRQEEERQRKLSELDAQEKAIQEAKEKYGDNPAIQQKAFELWRQRLAVTTGVTPGHYRPPAQEDILTRLLGQGKGEPITTQVEGRPSSQQIVDAAKEGLTVVQSIEEGPEYGAYAKLPPKEAAQMVADGKAEFVFNPLSQPQKEKKKKGKPASFDYLGYRTKGFYL